MNRSLSKEVALAAALEKLAFDMVSAIRMQEDHQELFHAHVTLGVRVLQDLRCCVLVARSGYTMQCWALAASAFEAANMAGFIGEDRDRAARWLAHKDLNRSFGNVKDNILGTIKFFELADTPTEVEKLQERDYQLYGRLCIAKHINPRSERYRYFAGAKGITRLTLTPTFSSARVKEAKLGLALASRAGIVVLGVLAKVHLSEDQAELSKRFKSLSTRTASIVSNWKNLDEELQD